MVICDLGREYSAAADVTFVYIYLYCICSIGLLRPCDVLLWRLFLFLRNYPYDLFRNSAKRIYLFEIKRVRRITSFSGNELATVLIAVVYIALLVWETLTVQRYEKYSD